MAPVLALGLTACGSSGSTGTPSVSSEASSSEAGPDLASLSATEILALTREAIAAQSSVHVVAEINGGTIDITVARGEGGKGDISLQGLTFEFIATGGTFYLRGSKEFYAEFAPGLESLFGDKWLSDSLSSESVQEFIPFSDMDVLLNEELLEPVYTGEFEFTVGEPSEYNGVPAIGLTTTTPDAGDVTLWIALEGEPLPLALSGGDAQRIDFLEWGAPVDLVAPPADDVVDLSELG